MTSYHIKSKVDNIAVDFEICDRNGMSLFNIKKTGEVVFKNSIMSDINNDEVVLYIKGERYNTLKTIYLVKNEDDIEILKISKYDSKSYLTIKGLFGDLRVTKVESNKNEFKITKDGALIGQLSEDLNKKNKSLQLEVYDSFFTLILLAILIVVDVHKYY